VDSGIPATEDKDLERLYAQARRYALLTRGEEQQIDERKWASIRQLQTLLLADPFGRNYLSRWAHNCSLPLPAIGSFGRREQHFLLRRELADYLPRGAEAAQLAALGRQLSRSSSARKLMNSLLELKLPASLVVGMAEVVIAGQDQPPKGKVASALRAWEQQWAEKPGTARASAPATTSVDAMSAQIARYTWARDQLIMHNLRLVYSIAGRNRNKGVAFLELVQEGTLGLLRAAEKFQFERGYRFSTYAFNWITQAVRRYLADAAGTIRYPSHMQEQLGRVHGERGRELARSGMVPTDSELASKLGLPVTRTRELLQLRNFGVSLETPKFQDEGGATLLDSIAGGPFAGPGDEAEQASLKHRLLSEIRLLEPAEQQVVIRRWGLHQGPPLTRAEIADQMAVSREWVRQLERSALDKLGQSETIHAVYEDHLSVAGN